MYLESLWQGFHATMAPSTLGAMVNGLLIGLMFGAVPGLNGVVGIVLILPFLWGSDPYVAFAILLALLAAVQTSNTFPAFYFNLPGTPTAAATILDGYPMARKGEAAKGLVAAFAASAVGGVIAALIVFASLPMLRAIVLQVASPERLVLVLLGLVSVSVLCGPRMSRGLIACMLGLLLGTAGQDPQAGALRYTFGAEYLIDGINLIPFVIGLFAFPEVLGLAARGQIAETPTMKLTNGLGPGLRAVWKHRWLTAGGSVLGTLIGAVPGLGGTEEGRWTASWIASSCGRRSSYLAAASP
jgi:TctA family transporter